MNITTSILHLIPEAQFMCWENDYARITWNDTNTKPLPSLADLELAWPLVQAKEAQADINNKALAYLSSTDWRVTRYAETGTPVPVDITLARAAARQDIK